MFQQHPVRSPFLRSTGASFAVHLLAFGALLGYPRRHPFRVVTLPGTAQGSHVELVYLPGRATVPAVRAKLQPKVTAVAQLTPPSAAESIPAPPILALPPRPHLTLKSMTSPTNRPSPASPVPDTTMGSDSWGNGAIQIAFTTYSPSPAPDLSALPPGVQGDVIVDVTIDPTGKVADLEVLKTLGYGIDSTVVSTVRTWTFRPATKDGTPIASVQELHFHFGPV
jgi:periplasmic protein TonB